MEREEGGRGKNKVKYSLSPCVSSKVQEEQRKKEIHESKYLGGDMEHTHLVKGLDYSLLQKVHVVFVWLVASV